MLDEEEQLCLCVNTHKKHIVRISSFDHDSLAVNSASHSWRWALCVAAQTTFSFKLYLVLVILPTNRARTYRQLRSKTCEMSRDDLQLKQMFIIDIATASLFLSARRENSAQPFIG